MFRAIKYEVTKRCVIERTKGLSPEGKRLLQALSDELIKKVNQRSSLTRNEADKYMYAIKIYLIRNYNEKLRRIH